jgi:hypothetical protein
MRREYWTPRLNDFETSGTEDQSSKAEGWEPVVGACMDFLDELLAYYRSGAMAT